MSLTEAMLLGSCSPIRTRPSIAPTRLDWIHQPNVHGNGNYCSAELTTGASEEMMAFERRQRKKRSSSVLAGQSGVHGDGSFPMAPELKRHSMESSMGELMKQQLIITPGPKDAGTVATGTTMGEDVHVCIGSPSFPTGTIHTKTNDAFFQHFTGPARVVAAALTTPKSSQPSLVKRALSNVSIVPCLGVGDITFDLSDLDLLDKDEHDLTDWTETDWINEDAARATTQPGMGGNHATSAIASSSAKKMPPFGKSAAIATSVASTSGSVLLASSATATTAKHSTSLIKLSAGRPGKSLPLLQRQYKRRYSDPVGSVLQKNGQFVIFPPKDAPKLYPSVEEIESVASIGLTPGSANVMQEAANDATSSAGIGGMISRRHTTATIPIFGIPASTRNLVECQFEGVEKTSAFARFSPQQGKAPFHHQD